MIRVRRRGRCGGLVGSPGGGGRGQDPRAAALSPSQSPIPRLPARASEAPPRPGHPGARPWPAAPRPALRYLGAPERAWPRPAAAPHLLPALAPGPGPAQGTMAAGRPRRRRAGPAGRTEAPEPAARDSTSSRSAPRLRRRRRRRATQWERAGRDSPRPGRFGPHAWAPAAPHLPASPFFGCPTHRWRRGLGLPVPQSPNSLPRLAFSLSSPQEPLRRPLQRLSPPKLGN